MQLLNKAITRQANIEEKCTARFWKGRYKSHPLLTDEALLTAMAYVDLNPARAKMAATPKTSDQTSIKERTQTTYNLASACANNTHPYKNNTALIPLFLVVGVPHGFSNPIKINPI